MFVPEGFTEKQVLDAIERVAASVPTSFLFGSHDIEDLRQLARLLCIEALEKRQYDPSRPIDNYLQVCVRGGILNWRRKHLWRTDCPCDKCHAGEFCRKGEPCKKYRDWLARNTTKANLQHPLGLEIMPAESEPQFEEAFSKLEVEELYEIIDREMPIELRATWLQMRDGVNVPKVKRQEVLDFMRGVI